MSRERKITVRLSDKEMDMLEDFTDKLQKLFARSYYETMYDI